MPEKWFSPPVLFQLLLIEITKDEVLFYKNNEQDCFYWFDKEQWHRNFKDHMADKNWFTKDMSDFINKNV